MVSKVSKIRFFDTERQAENFLKRNRKKIKIPGFVPTIQGNALVLIPKKKRK